MQTRNGSEVVVLFTTPAPTLAALETARRLSWGRDEPVRLVVTLPVPYPLPLTSPPVLLKFFKRQMHRLALASCVDTQIDLYLCRDRCEALRDHLQPSSTVVLGGKWRRWWGSREHGLARWLQAKGHTVVLATPEEEAGRRLLSPKILQFRMPNSSH